MNNNLMKLVVFAILFFIFAMAFSYFKSINRPEAKAPAYVTYSDIDQEVAPSTSEKMRESFVGGCMEGQVLSRKVCSCTYSYLEENLGVDGVLKMATKYNEIGEMPKIVDEAFEYCITK